MLKITLDTNVLVSGSFWTGDSFKILDLIDRKKIICIISKEIIAEYDKTIGSNEIIEKIENKSLILSKLVQKVILNSEIVEPKDRLNIVKNDSSDNKILECAKEGKVNFIITKDNHLLKLKEFGEIKIVTPDEFIKIYCNLTEKNVNQNVIFGSLNIKESIQKIKDKMRNNWKPEH